MWQTLKKREVLRNLGTNDKTGLTEEKSCETCGRVMQQQTTIAAKGHNYVDGECTNCGKEELGGDYPYAGLGDYAVILMAVVIIAVVCYKKSNKYRDII